MIYWDVCVCVWIFIPWSVAGSSVASFQSTSYHAKALSSVVILGSFLMLGALACISICQPRKSGEARLVCSFNHREGYTVAWFFNFAWNDRFQCGKIIDIQTVTSGSYNPQSLQVTFQSLQIPNYRNRFLCLLHLQKQNSNSNLNDYWPT